VIITIPSIAEGRDKLMTYDVFYWLKMANTTQGTKKVVELMAVSRRECSIRTLGLRFSNQCRKGKFSYLHQSIKMIFFVIHRSNWTEDVLFLQSLRSHSFSEICRSLVSRVRVLQQAMSPFSDHQSSLLS